MKINLIKSIILGTFSLFCLVSCSSIKQSNNDIDESFNEKTLRLPKVQLDEAGLISKVDETGASLVNSNDKILEFCNTGDAYIVEANKNYQFDFRNFNPKTNTLATEITPTGEILIKVVDINANKVILKEKCQSQIWYSTSVPIVEVFEGSKEQVVITPLFKDGCIHYAYEIRLGSVESGCGTQKVREILKKRKECSGQKVKKNRIRKISEIFNPYN